MKFTKMQGCGNDYVYIDGAAEEISQADKAGLVRALSDRHFGRSEERRVGKEC